MTFGSDHYVPVLKVKRGEKTALQLVAPALRSRITPLLEIVEWRRDKKPTLSAHLDTSFKGLSESLGSYPECFLDVRELAPHGRAGAEEVFGRAVGLGIPFIPVTGMSRPADLAPAIANNTRGLAIRLTRVEFERGDLNSQIRSFMAQNHLEYDATDLIVDLGPVEDLIEEGIAALGSQFIRDVPNAGAWRTLTLSASAFPRSMGIVERKSHAFADRAEWLAWRNHLRREDQVPRVPTYSDCVIQHPAGVEGFNPVLMQVSATIRYALPERWILIKGESTRRNPPSVQFPQLAKHLVYGHLRGHYFGQHHCQGCNSIKSAADGQKGLGSPEVWRRIGTVHHMTEVMQALSSLRGS
jgi:hypothetical protein